MLSLLQHPNLDPIIFSIPGTPLALRWYGLMYVLAFTVGYFVLRWAQSTGYLRLKAEEIMNLIVWGVIGTFLGGRIGYVLFYQFDRLVLNVDNLELLDRLYMLIAVWEGGLSFHGGVFGVAAALIYYSWRNKVNVLNLHDAGVLFIRWAWRWCASATSSTASSTAAPSTTPRATPSPTRTSCRGTP
jgi:phosphatidylglycerol---prolipoprotein diacylglyceryl transferase